MKFLFKIHDDLSEPNTLIFAKKDCIFEYNVLTDNINVLCIYDINLNREPEFFLMNDDQSTMIVWDKDDGIFFSLEQNL